MKNLKVIVTGLVIAMSISGMSASLSSIFRKKKNKSTSTTAGAPTQASSYCVSQGGESILVKSKKGDFRVCKLRNGTTIDEWEYYRNNAPTVQDFERQVLNSENPAAKFCIAKGGKSLKVKDRNGAEKGICQFSNGTKVDEWDYYRANH